MTPKVPFTFHTQRLAEEAKELRVGASTQGTAADSRRGDLPALVVDLAWHRDGNDLAAKGAREERLTVRKPKPMAAAVAGKT